MSFGSFEGPSSERPNFFSLFELYLRRQITSYRSLQLLHIDLCRHLEDGRRRDVQKGPRNYVNVTSFSVTQDSFSVHECLSLQFFPGIMEWGFFGYHFVEIRLP